MAALDELVTPSLTFEEILSDGSTLTNPAADGRRLFLGEDGLLHLRDSSGTVTGVAAGATGGVDSGTSFPGSPTDGDLFYRTDIDLLCRYRSTGTRWVTANLYRAEFGINTSNQPLAAAGDPGSWSGWHSDFDLWLEKFYGATFVLTTNTGSAYWTLSLKHAVANNTESNIVTYNTSAHAASTWITAATAIGALYDPSTYKRMTVAATKTGSPGNLYWGNFSVSYRLVVT